MRWKALAEIYTMHSFAPFSNLNFFVKLLRNFRHFFHSFCYFSVILLDFFEILLKFCRNLKSEFLEISRKSIKFANFYEFQGMPDKNRTQIRRRPIVRPLDGVEVAVRGPSPGEGGGSNRRSHGRRSQWRCRMRLRVSSGGNISKMGVTTVSYWFNSCCP